MIDLNKLSKQGDWQIQRCIFDNLSNVDFTFKGIATFKYNMDHFLYAEKGELLNADGFKTKAIQSYKYYSLQNSIIECRFPDDRIFYTLNLKDFPCFNVSHNCGNDIYKGILTFSADSWKTNWSIKGPKKSMDIETIYTLF